MIFLLLLFPLLSMASPECERFCLNRVHELDIEMIIEARKNDGRDPLPRAMLPAPKTDPACRCWDNIEWACAIYKGGKLSNDEGCRAEMKAKRAKEREEGFKKYAEDQKILDDAKAKRSLGEKLTPEDNEKLMDVLIKRTL